MTLTRPRRMAREFHNLLAAALIALLGLSFTASFGAQSVALMVPLENVGQYHPPTDRRLCVQDNGWTRWNDALPGVTQRLRDHGINVVNWDDCSSQPDNVVVVITAVSTSENFCARTVRGAYVNGVAQQKTYIQMNMWPGYFNQCHSTAAQRQHVVSHELGHYLGLVHNSEASVMGSWAYNWYTALDYSNLATIFG
jgi:hypothetical protein